VAYNQEHGIQPRTVVKALPEGLRKIYGLEADDAEVVDQATMVDLDEVGVGSAGELDALIRKKQKEMKKQAADLEFEKAAQLRDEIARLRELMLRFGGEAQAPVG
jgi:excinuclease ABC subunit B